MAVISLGMFPRIRQLDRNVNTTKIDRRLARPVRRIRRRTLLKPARLVPILPACDLSVRRSRGPPFTLSVRRSRVLRSQAMNYLRTAILLAGLTALFMAIGYLIGGEGGMMIAFLIAAAMNLFSYWNADKLVLSMHGAHEVDERAAPELYAIVRDLARNAGLPMPRIYLMENPQPNAFATGRNPDHAAVAATTGLLETLTREEIAGVLAHELAHVKNRDTLTMTITATIAGAISM